MKSSVDYYQNEFKKFNEFAENFELHKVYNFPQVIQSFPLLFIFSLNY
jgi:hypothetical protein